MATTDDVRHLALAFPETTEQSSPNKGTQFIVSKKDFAWTFMEWVSGVRKRMPQPEVLVVRTPSVEEKEMLLESAPEKFFTTPHYKGYPAVLVRLSQIELDELRDVLTDAWCSCASPKQLAAFDAEREESA